MRRQCEARSLRVKLEMRKSELEELRSIYGHGSGSVVLGGWDVVNTEYGFSKSGFGFV